MKILDQTFTSADLLPFKAIIRDEPILFTTMNGNWEHEWSFLLNKNQELVTDIETAADIVRNDIILSQWGTGLATISQAIIGNAQWDNL